MRPRKRDWKVLEKVMPGVVPSGQEPWAQGALYSVSWNLDETWSLVRGSLLREAKEKITQRMEIIRRGSALEVTQEMMAVGFTFPLMEQWEGDLDLPTPKDIYFEACCKRLPGRFLSEVGDAARIGLSLTVARRSGWKIRFFELPDEDELFCGDYLVALERGEFPPVHVLGQWQGKNVGSRHGVIRDEDLPEVLGWFNVEPKDIFGLKVGDWGVAASAG